MPARSAQACDTASHGRGLLRPEPVTVLGRQQHFLYGEYLNLGQNYAIGWGACLFQHLHMLCPSSGHGHWVKRWLKGAMLVFNVELWSWYVVLSNIYFCTEFGPDRKDVEDGATTDLWSGLLK